MGRSQPILFSLRSWPERAGRAVRHRIYGSALYPLTLNRRAPESLRGLPPDSWSGDPKAGSAILDGRFMVAGEAISPGRDPWSRAGGEDWAAELNQFAWLADLAALGGEAARARARALVAGWIEHHRRWSLPAWRADVLGLRLTHWFRSQEFLLAGADNAFRRRFLVSAARQARHLRREAASLPVDARALRALKGMIYAGIFLPGFEPYLETGLALLDQQTARQVLPDGGHFQRNPSLHLDALRHLVDIRQTLSAAGADVPPSLQAVIDRMAPMLRSFRLGDGTLARFNGGLEGDGRVIDAVLAQAGVRGKALSSAPHSGFQRLAAGRTVIVVDTGTPPPAGDRLAHAGTLSFEMSVGKDRMVVNCGAYAGANAAWRAALRATAAHSTLTVDNTNSTEILAASRIGARPTEVTHLRREADGDVWLQCSHNGYAKAFGLVHRRNLYLDASGEDFRGEDAVIGPGGRGFALRFHLHPLVKASVMPDGASVLLRLPKGGGWRFRAKGGSVRLEESVYIGAPGQRRRSEQIVVAGPLNGDGATVKWAFRREKGR